MASHCVNCGSTSATRSARREGRLWFCSQSCFLQAESRLKRPAERARRSSPVRAFRILGKTIKWAVITVVLVVVALVVAVVVGASHALNKSEHKSHRASVAFRHVRH